jgi:hypothetical protein
MDDVGNDGHKIISNTDKVTVCGSLPQMGPCCYSQENYQRQCDLVISSLKAMLRIPEELHWIQHLIARHGVSGTLQLISATCEDTANRIRAPQVASRWRECGRIIEDAVGLLRRVEPAWLIEDEPPQLED